MDYSYYASIRRDVPTGKLERYSGGTGPLLLAFLTPTARERALAGSTTALYIKLKVKLSLCLMPSHDDLWGRVREALCRQVKEKGLCSTCNHLL